MKDVPLQNIPIRSELGRQIRAGFINRPTLTNTADYAKIERAILEHIKKAAKR